MRVRAAGVVLVAGLALGGFFLGVQPGEEVATPPVAAPSSGATAAAPGAATPSSGAFATPGWNPQDRAGFQGTVDWALSFGLDTASVGDAMALIGRKLVGTPYRAHTLEEGDDTYALVNFRGLDCVTFVENVYALARFVRQPDVRDVLAHPGAAEARYVELLAQLRYRAGRPDGYASRLHYFSDWIRDNEARGLVVDVTRALGGTAEDEAVDFMTTHPESYPQLSHGGHLTAIRASEERLSATPRYVIPQERIADIEGEIRDGDIIAATSTVAGLDVAHTGLAVWVQGELRLLHAPLVGHEVQISAVSLAERISRISGQDGIMVARPVEG